jgi:protoheme ferro-lyase
MKRVIVPKYIFRDKLGTFVLDNIEVLVEVDSKVTAETFDQDKDDYYISSKEIDRMVYLATLRKIIDE